MSAVVAKKIRLFDKDNKGLFIKDGANKVLRKRAVILEDTVKESNNSYKETGILWVIDKAKTKARLDIQAEVKAKNKSTKK